MMGLYYDFCILLILISNVYSALKPAATKDWLIEFHHHVEPDVAESIAKSYAMVSQGPVCGLFSINQSKNICFSSGVK